MDGGTKQTGDWRVDLAVLLLSPWFDLWWQREVRRVRRTRRQWFEPDQKTIRDAPRRMALRYMLDLSLRPRKAIGSDEDNPGFENVVRLYEEDR